MFNAYNLFRGVLIAIAAWSGYDDGLRNVTAVLVLVVLWALGLIEGVDGGLVHLRLVLAVIIIAVNLLRGRRTAI